MAKKLVFNPLLKKGFQNESREDLAETLVIGNITGGTDITLTSGDKINSSSGGGELDLRYGGSDGELILSTDNGAYTAKQQLSDYATNGEVQLYADKLMIRRGASRVTGSTNGIYIKDGDASGFVQIGVGASSVNNDAIKLQDGGGVATITSDNAKASVIISSQNSYADTAITYSPIFGGDTIVSRTANTAYVNQLAIQTAGSSFDMVLDTGGVCADRTATFQNATGTVAYLSDITGGAVVQTGQTTNNVQLTLSASQAIAVQSVQSFVTRVTAIQSLAPSAGTIGDVWVHEFRGAIKNIAGTPALVDSIIDEYIAEDAAMTGVSVAIVAGASTLDIKVTGETGKEIEGKAETIFSEIIYV